MARRKVASRKNRTASKKVTKRTSKRQPNDLSYLERQIQYSHKEEPTPQQEWIYRYEGVRTPAHEHKDRFGHGEEHEFLVRICTDPDDKGYQDNGMGDHDGEIGSFVAYGCCSYKTREEMERHYQVHAKDKGDRGVSIESHTYRPQVEHLINLAAAIFKKHGMKW